MLELKKRAVQVQFKDLDAYISWYKACSGEDLHECWNSMCFDGPDSKIIYTAADKMLHVHLDWWFNHDKQNYLDHLQKITEYAQRFNQPLEMKCRNQWFAVIYCSNPENFIGIWNPDEHLSFLEPPDRSHLTSRQLQALVSGKDGDSGFTSIVPANASSLSVNSVKAEMQDAQAEANELKSQMADVEKAASGELAELRIQIEKMQQELEAKKEAMLADLREKQALFLQKEEDLKKQLFILSSQIYCIECYLGEAVSFHHLKQGKNAPDTEPIVLHQKLRFLDEELGRLASIYELDWDDKELFEDFLSRSPEAVDIFAPNLRCISLVRLSKTGITHGRSEKFPYSNMLVDYEYYHGKTCGIIIRNGENLYFGWTDEERIQITDDLILTLQTVDVQPDKLPERETSWDRERRLKEEEDTKNMIMKEYLSRVFIFNILQGVVDHSANLLPLPKGVKLSRQSEYVQFALADKWLADTRFGSFNDIVNRCNSKLTKGDHILVTQHLRPEYERHSRNYYIPDTYENPRGRGEANRMRDCSVDDCSIYPINLIEYDKPIPMVHYSFTRKALNGPVTYNCVIEKDSVDQLTDDCVIGEEYERIDRHVYISVEKDFSISGARSNFELYDEEYINLTYMNSVWLEWVINIRNLGGWTIKGNPVTYAYAIRYIKTALDFVRKREVGEKALLDKVDPSYTAQNPEWPLALSEWKLEKGVREITEYQAKRFIRAVKAQ